MIKLKYAENDSFSMNDIFRSCIQCKYQPKTNEQELQVSDLKDNLKKQVKNKEVYGSSLLEISFLFF